MSLKGIRKIRVSLKKNMDESQIEWQNKQTKIQT